MAFAVSYTGFPPDTAFMGMDYRRGRVLNSKLITHAGHPGRESTIKTRDGAFHRLRYFEVGQRVYDISVSTRKEEKLHRGYHQAAHSWQQECDVLPNTFDTFASADHRPPAVRHRIVRLKFGTSAIIAEPLVHSHAAAPRLLPLRMAFQRTIRR